METKEWCTSQKQSEYLKLARKRKQKFKAQPEVKNSPFPSSSKSYFRHMNGLTVKNPTSVTSPHAEHCPPLRSVLRQNKTIS